MSDENEFNWIRVEEWIREGWSFVLYRQPGEEVIHALMQSEAVTCFTDITSLNGKTGFVFSPFHIEEKLPLVLLHPEEKLQLTWKAEKDADGGEEINSVPSASYSACFESFIGELKQKHYDKLVLSRSVLMERKEGFSELAAFRAACSRFVYSYVYLFYTPETGFWMGCTPEILLSGSENEYHTVALAGTQPLISGELPLSWDMKNRDEQNYVTEYIVNQLASIQIDCQKKGPYAVKAGALSHLKTDIHFSLKEKDKLGELLQLLHPTPAVCGVPKERAREFILKEESGSRKYYSGFLGWLEPEGDTSLYVNLRCMQIQDNGFILYAGGGILASSNIMDEWQETVRKMGTMRYVVRHGYEK